MIEPIRVEIIILGGQKIKSWWPPPNLRNQSHDFFPGTWPFQMSQTTGDKKMISIFFSCVPPANPFRKKKLSTKNAPELFSCGLKTWIFSKKHRFRDYFFGSGEAGQKAECTEEDNLSYIYIIICILYTIDGWELIFKSSVWHSTCMPTKETKNF